MIIVIAATIVNTDRFHSDEGGPERSELAKQSHKISQ